MFLLFCLLFNLSWKPKKYILRKIYIENTKYQTQEQSILIQIIAHDGENYK